MYAHAPGLVARCPGCDEVVLRLVRAPDRAWLDLRGMVALEIPMPPEPGGETGRGLDHRRGRRPALPRVVLSAEAHNDRPRAAPFCAPVVRQRGVTEDLPPFAVALAETDPISGVVVLSRMRRIRRRPAPSASACSPAPP